MSQYHRDAIASVLYGVRERKCFVLLTGEIGSGKTTLCRAVIKDLEGNGARVVLILDSFINETELLEAICEQLHIEPSARTRRGLMDALHRHLDEQHRLNRLVVVLIDEAQNLSDGTLEQIRLLGNLETEQEKLLQIVLVGQPELRSTLRDSKLEQLDQRIAVRCHLRPLEPSEVEPYIYHRLRVAGLSAAIDFPQRTLKMIYEFTGGVPRKINLLCDRALLAGYVASTRVIDEAIVRAAAMEVGGDQWTGRSELAALRQGGRPARARPTAWSTVLYALVIVFALITVPVALNVTSIWDWWFSVPREEPSVEGKSFPAPTPTPTPSPTPQPTAIGGTRSVASVSQEVPAGPPALRAGGTRSVASVGQPTPSPPASMVEKPPPLVPPAVDASASVVFRLAPAKQAEPWSYDDDRVVRVAQSEFCKTAAILTLLAAWGMDVNLEDFRKLSASDALRLDLIELNRDRGLRQTEIKGGLARALVFDVPVIVELADPDRRLSDYVVLLSVKDDLSWVADPIHGVQELPRSLLELFWQRALVVYFDPDDIQSLKRGQRSPAAQAVQETLRDLDYYGAPITGEFDRLTVAAVEAFQRFFQLPPTGQLDPATVMLITCHRHRDRPRLTPPLEGRAPSRPKEQPQ